MAAPASPRGGFSAEDLAGLSDDERRKLLERNPHLAEIFADADKAARGASSRAARPGGAATDRAPRGDDVSARMREAGLDPEHEARMQAETNARIGARVRRAKEKEAKAAKRKRDQRRASAGRLGRRVVRETPGLPGPSATSLLLTFAGSTLAVVGLVLLVEGGPAFGRLPAAIGTLAGRLTDPTDPIF